MVLSNYIKNILSQDKAGLFSKGFVHQSHDCSKLLYGGDIQECRTFLDLSFFFLKNKLPRFLLFEFWSSETLNHL